MANRAIHPLIFKLVQPKVSGMEERLADCEQEVLLAISCLGDRASNDAILHAVQRPSVNEAAVWSVGNALRVLEHKGLISRIATDVAQSKDDTRYVLSVEGIRVLTDRKEHLASLRRLLDHRIAQYCRRSRSERNSEHKRMFWSGIGWN